MILEIKYGVQERITTLNVGNYFGHEPERCRFLKTLVLRHYSLAFGIVPWTSIPTRTLGPMRSGH